MEYGTFFSVSDIDYNYIGTRIPNVIRLKELCASKLVSDGLLLQMNCFDLPQPLRNLLIRFAISHGCESSVTTLLKARSHEKYVFEPPVPFKTWKIFVSTRESCDSVNKLSCFVKLIVDHFLTSLNPDCENQMHGRSFDFSDFPIGRPCLIDICKHIIEKCILFSNHCNFGKKTDEAKKKKCSDSPSSVNKSVLKINCILDSREDTNFLILALDHLKVTRIPLDLLVTGVHFCTSYISYNILQLLDLLEPEALESFTCCFTYNDLQKPHNIDVMRKLGEFRNLRALTFQLYSLDSNFTHRSNPVLTDVIHQLKNLKHINLSHNEYYTTYIYPCPMMSEIIPFKLSSLSGQLECLIFKGYNLSAKELKYLSVSPHALALRSLTLSYTKHNLHRLLQLLTACKHLHVLNLEGCDFLGGSIDLLFQVFANMEELRYLNILGMDISPKDLLSKAVYISRMSSLQFLSISSRFMDWDRVAAFGEKFRHAVKMLLKCPSKMDASV